MRQNASNSFQTSLPAGLGREYPMARRDSGVRKQIAEIDRRASASGGKRTCYIFYPPAPSNFPLGHSSFATMASLIKGIPAGLCAGTAGSILRSGQLTRKGKPFGRVMKLGWKPPQMNDRCGTVSRAEPMEPPTASEVADSVASYILKAAEELELNVQFLVGCIEYDEQPALMSMCFASTGGKVFLVVDSRGDTWLDRCCVTEQRPAWRIVASDDPEAIASQCLELLAGTRGFSPTSAIVH